MEALKRKWNSRRGASILLAMLFLLVCMMAGASILMAAASNAGKIDSNKTEQQKYLAVSSAMTMLVEELERVTYQGQYTYTQTPVPKMIQDTDDEGNPKQDEDGNPILVPAPVRDDAGNLIPGNIDHYIHTYTQKPGTLMYTSGGSGTWLDTVLPLRDYYDYIFAENFKKPTSGTSPDDVYSCKSLKDDDSNPLANPGNSFTLTFTAPNGYGGLNEQVTINVDLRSDGSILLKATTKDDTGAVDFTMKALLDPKTDGNVLPDKLLVLPSNPGANGNIKTAEIKWKLVYIFKEEAKPDA